MPSHLAMKLCHRPDYLWQLRHQGILSDLEYNFCTLILERPERPEWTDGGFCWCFGISEEKLAACRDSLRAKGVLDYSPGSEFDAVVYQVLERKGPIPFRRPRCQPTGFPVPRQRWVVFEQGANAHLMREDDLFPAERTLCGLPALNADWHPLPHFNSQPADYPVCSTCHGRRSHSHPF